jgi:hypothetical protein
MKIPYQNLTSSTVTSREMGTKLVKISSQVPDIWRNTNVPEVGSILNQDWAAAS